MDEGHAKGKLFPPWQQGSKKKTKKDKMTLKVCPRELLLALPAGDQGFLN
jgi:hypothetical protein